VKSGRLWVIGLLAFGGVGALIAVSHWSKPENSVRWTFTQLHTSMLRKRQEPVLQIVGPEVLLDGRRLSRADFLAAYVPPAKPGDLDVAPCPACPAHWAVTMHGRAWCFAPEGRGWVLHRIGPAPCDAK
jgi:hypothetical protein